MKAYEPTFPTTHETKREGINLRDYIAVQAMTGLLASHAHDAAIDPVWIARKAYAISDAMREESYG